MLCKIFGWSNRVFFTVTPVLLLGLVPVMNGHAARQLIASAAMCGLEVGLLGGLFGGHPGLMTPLVFLLFLYRFAAMSRGSLFLFGANGVLSLSIMLHFASYPGIDLNDLIFSNLWASVLSVLIAYLMTALIPDVEAPQAGPSPRRRTGCGTKPCWGVHRDPLVPGVPDLRSARLHVRPGHHPAAALPHALERRPGLCPQAGHGHPAGVSFGILGQLVLYDWSGLLLLVTPVLWLGAMLFSYAHVKEASGSGVGFGALTTLGILFGQYLTPGNDLVFSALYRVSSILFAIVVTLLACYLIHRLLNRFEATRFGH